MTDFDTAWSLRLEHYLKTGSDNIHWSGIFINIGIIIALVGLISTMLQKGLNQDCVTFLKNRTRTNKRR